MFQLSGFYCKRGAKSELPGPIAGSHRASFMGFEGLILSSRRLDPYKNYSALSVL